jgi:hypothetical protein
MECRRVLRSLVYLLFVGVLVLVYFTQFQPDMDRDFADARQGLSSPLTKPQEGGNYGYKQAEIPEQVMPAIVFSLQNEYAAGFFSTYPLAFYRETRPDEEVMARIREILTEITGLSQEELSALRIEIIRQLQEEEKPLMYGGASDYTRYNIPTLVPYDVFRQRMAEVDTLLGGGSYYAPEGLANYGSVPLTYEEALAEYEDTVYQDRITGAYGRLFCDYLGIDIALFGAFVSVAMLMADRRAGARELVYSRGKNSLAVIGTRYFAAVGMMLLPVLLLSLFPLAQLAAFAGEQGLAASPLGFVTYILWWLLPSIMTVTAVGFVLTLLTDTPVAIAVQFLWSLLDVSGKALSGGEPGWGLAIRHNMVGSRAIIEELADAITANRLFFAAVSLGLLLLSAFLFELKRRGRLDVRDLLETRVRRAKD